MATLQSIQARIQKLQAQAQELAAAKSTEVLEKIRGLMEKHGVSVADIEAFVGKRHGRKSQPGAAAKPSTSTAKYADPKTGATWTGHGRAPAWIANAKDRTKFLVAGAAAESAASAKETPKAGRYVRGPQPALYRDPKTGATWSGRGRAPAWLASLRDRSKFLIADAAKPAAAPKAKAVKAVAARKAAAKTATAKKVLAKKAATKKVSAPARKTASKNGATSKTPGARKARVPKSTAKPVVPLDAGVSGTTTQIASAPAAF